MRTARRPDARTGTAPSEKRWGPPIVIPGAPARRAGTLPSGALSQPPSLPKVPGIMTLIDGKAIAQKIQLETLADMAKLFNSSRDQLCESILMVSKNLKDMADQMDLEMSAYADEKYQDSIVAQGVR